MNTAILRLARRHRDGSRRWEVPGFTNAAIIVPSRRSSFGVLTAFWPRIDFDGSEMRFGARLDWHRNLAKQEIRKLYQCAT